MAQNKKELAKMALAALLLASSPAAGHADETETTGTLLVAGCPASSKGCAASSGCGASNGSGSGSTNTGSYGTSNPAYRSNPNYNNTYDTTGSSTGAYRSGSNYDTTGNGTGTYRSGSSYDTTGTGTGAYRSGSNYDTTGSNWGSGSAMDANTGSTRTTTNPRTNNYDTTTRR